MRRRGNIVASLVREIEGARERTDALIARCLEGGATDADLASVERALRFAEALAAVPRRVA